MTVAEEKRLFGLVRWRVRQWASNPEFEDMLSQAYLRAWEEWLKPSVQACRDPIAVAAYRARFGPLDYIREWRGQRVMRRYSSEVVSLDEIADLPAPDRFEEAVIDRLMGQQLWRWARQLCTDLQFEALWLRNGLGLGEIESARRLGVSLAVLKQRHYLAWKKCRRLAEGPP